MDVMARLCLGDLSLRRGACKVDFRNGTYLLSLPSGSRLLSSGSAGSAGSAGSVLNSRSAGVHVVSGSSVVSRGRRVC